MPPEAAIGFAGTERYQIRAKLGSGGFGVVYRAFDRQLGTEVALKTLTRLDPQAIYRFKREFRALADVTHENLVQLHDLVAGDERTFLTMELIEGCSFLEWVRPGSRVDLGRLRDAARQLARGVEALHEANVLHRDLKPSNVLVARDGRVVLVDFGIVIDLAERIDDRTDAGAVIGTPEYMAPEQGRGVSLGPAADWYAVGTILFEAISGRRPFVGSPVSVLLEKSRSEPPRLSTIVSDVPAALDELCASLMRLEPEARVGGAAVLAAFDASLQGEVVGAVPFSERRPITTGDAPRAAEAGRARHETLDSARIVLRTPPSGAPAPATLAESTRSANRSNDANAASAQSGATPSSEPRRGTRTTAPARVSAAAVERAAAGPLIGRREALSTLAQALEAAWTGRGSTVVIRGRSGMGKSALMRSFLDRIADGTLAIDEDGGSGIVPLAQTVVLAGRCYERESVPYKAFDSVVDALSRHLLTLLRSEADALTPRDAAALVRVFPVLGRVPSIADAARRNADVGDPQQQRLRAFGALREMFGRLAAMRPVVVYIDDLQWGDVDSAPLLAELCAEPDAPNLLLVLAHRSETDSAARAALVAAATARGRPVHRIEIERLSALESKRLAEALLASQGDGEENAASGMVDEIVATAAGDPFVVHQLCRFVMARSRDGLASDGRRAVLADVLAQRLAALPETQRRLLEAIAVAGRPIARDLAARAAQIPSDQAREALAALRDAQLVRPSAGPRKSQFEAYHDRIRQAVYDALDEPARRLWHRSIADALAIAGEPEAEAMFVHLRGAGDVGRALRFAERAAEDAVAALAFDHAAQLYASAIAMLDREVASTASRARARARHLQSLRVARAHALVLAGRGADAARAFIEAASYAEAHEQLELRRLAGEQWLCAGHLDEGIEVIGRVVEEIGLRLPGSLVAAIVSIVWLRLLLAVRGHRPRLRAPSSIPASELARIDVCASVANGLGIVDRVSGAVFQHRQLYWSLSAGEPMRLARALALEGAYVGAASGRDGPRLAEALFVQAETLARKHEHPEVMPTIAAARGLTAQLHGRWGAARASLEQAIDGYREVHLSTSRWELATSKYYLFMTLAYAGDLLAAQQRSAAWLREAEDFGDLYTLTNLQLGEATWLALARGEYAQARPRANAAIERWSNRNYASQHYWALLSNCYVDLYEGRGAQALRRIEAEVPTIRRNFMFQVLTVRAPIAFLRGAAASSAAANVRDRRPLVALVGRMITSLRREEHPWADALAATLDARLAALRGDASARRDALDLAATTFERAEMPLAAAFARRRAALLAGGASGAETARACETLIAERGVIDVERMGALYLGEPPG